MLPVYRFETISWSVDSHFRQIRRLPSGEDKEILSIGLACSECFHGPRLAKLLQPGLEYEQKVMEQLMAGEMSSPLSIHTSSGVPDALAGFIDALAPHLPWANQDELIDIGAIEECLDAVLQDGFA